MKFTQEHADRLVNQLMTTPTKYISSSDVLDLVHLVNRNRMTGDN